MTKQVGEADLMAYFIDSELRFSCAYLFKHLLYIKKMMFFKLTMSFW